MTSLRDEIGSGRGAGDGLLARMSVELILGGGFGGGIGALNAVLASVLEKGRVEAPLLVLGVISGLVTGVVAVVTGREVLPRLVGYSFPVRAALMVLSLVGGAFAATLLGFWIYPWYVIRSVRSVILVGSINGLLALVAGALVFVYEDLVRRLDRTRAMLAAERVAQAQARERAARAELQALQARINPHFFFNALNTATAYVSEDPAYAEHLLERFAGLFRYAFRRGSQRAVRLDEEMAFIRDYLEIEQARFGDKLRFEVDYDASLASRTLPPLILQPLVENAVLHGRDPETGEGRVLVRAEEGRAGSLVLEVRDEGPGPGAVDGQWPQGHALENVASRVDAFCGGRLVVGPAAPGPGTTARIVLTSQGD
ncbi:MAG: histidine kinase [Acidobacteriota bacterium]|nr:histidine kinase [Acidobacteriota bacterium]